jgi:hypothetical protein
MSRPPELDVGQGRLLIGESALRVLVAHTADPVAIAVEGDSAVADLAALTEAGVIAGGRAHPAVAGALAAMVRPDLCTLELSHSGKAMQGWLSHEAAALLLPARDPADERRVLLALHPTVVPGALAGLVDLAPREQADGREPCSPDELADVARRWRLVASWELADGTHGSDGLEVIDTATGVWLLTGAPADRPAPSPPAAGAPGDRPAPSPLAWPVTPTLVWRHIVRLVMRRAAASRSPGG